MCGGFHSGTGSAEFDKKIEEMIKISDPISGAGALRVVAWFNGDTQGSGPENSVQEKLETGRTTCAGES